MSAKKALTIKAFSRSQSCRIVRKSVSSKSETLPHHPSEPPPTIDESRKAQIVYRFSFLPPKMPLNN